VCFLLAAYIHEFYWWELTDLVEKLFLTGLLGFVPANAQCPVGMAVWYAPLTRFCDANEVVLTVSACFVVARIWYRFYWPIRSFERWMIVSAVWCKCIYS
jgi:hypothetical protein